MNYRKQVKYGVNNQGWISLHRKILEWEWYNDINTCRLFIHLLLVCNHKKKKWQGKIIKPGQKVTSVEKLAIETGLTKQQVRTCIKKLKSTSEITCKSTNKFTLININNYSIYQEKNIESNTQNNKQSNKQITNKQQTNNKQITTNNNDNNDNNDNKVSKQKKSLTKIDYDYLINKYTNNEHLAETINEYIAMRINKKAKPTMKALELVFKDLDKYSNNNDNIKIKILEESIKRNWTGVFELKAQAPGQATKFNNYDDPDMDFDKIEQIEQEYLQRKLKKIKEGNYE